MNFDDGEWLDFPKAGRLKPEKLVHDCLIEEKIDGERLALWRGHAYGRRISEVTGRRENRWDTLPDHVKATAPLVPVEGELFVEGGTSSDVKHCLKEAPERVGFCAFRPLGRAANQLDGWGQRAWLTRRGLQVPRLLSHFSKEAAHTSVRPEPLVRMLEDGTLERIARHVRIEGWIVKAIRVGPPLWWKFKLEDTVDLVVTGIHPGNAGKYQGMCGALIGSAYVDGEFREVARVSGMDDATREAITEKDVGRVFEVRYQQIASKGRLRHPRFLRWRDDKPASECVLQAQG